MSTHMLDLIAELEIRLVNTVERLHDTLAFVADRIAVEGVASR